jgi:hypothetical protein
MEEQEECVMRKAPRLCLFCKQLHFYAGEPGYSEMTPGSDMELFCEKKHWDAHDFFYEDSYRKAMLMARECKDWDAVEWREEWGE